MRQKTRLGRISNLLKYSHILRNELIKRDGFELSVPRRGEVGYRVMPFGALQGMDAPEGPVSSAFFHEYLSRNEYGISLQPSSSGSGPRLSTEPKVARSTLNLEAIVLSLRAARVLLVAGRDSRDPDAADHPNFALRAPE
jgi:hypothetical protein